MDSTRGKNGATPVLKWAASVPNFPFITILFRFGRFPLAKQLQPIEADTSRLQ